MKMTSGNLLDVIVSFIKGNVAISWDCIAFSEIASLLCPS